jgi:hypothetical protein
MGGLSRCSVTRDDFTPHIALLLASSRVPASAHVRLVLFSHPVESRAVQCRSEGSLVWGVAYVSRRALSLHPGGDNEKWKKKCTRVSWREREPPPASRMAFPTRSMILLASFRRLKLASAASRVSGGCLSGCALKAALEGQPHLTRTLVSLRHLTLVVTFGRRQL